MALDKERKESYQKMGSHLIKTDLMLACLGNNIELVQYLLTSKDLKKNPQPKDCFLHACCNNETINIAHYLLTSPDLEHRVNIHFENDAAIAIAAEYGMVDMMKYLLTSPDLENHSYIYANGDTAFKEACSKNHYHVMEYLIFDYKIEKTKEIVLFLNSVDNDINNSTKMMFDKRDLEHKLINELKTTKKDNTSIKIKL